jgi:hypothetical protein
MCCFIETKEKEMAIESIYVFYLRIIRKVGKGCGKMVVGEGEWRNVVGRGM